MRAVLMLAALGLGACYTVQVRVEPSGAVVSSRDSGAESAPTEVRVRPLRGERLTVTAVNHRPFVVRVPWRPLGFLRRNHEVEVLLVEEHGAAGTAGR